MGRSPCCEKVGLKKGPWTPEEDQKLFAYVEEHGHGSWRALPAKAGLQRCGKSCRLRWTNYLRPGIKRGKFSSQEEQTIIQLHALLGNRWSAIATHLPKRTDNEIKNHWNTHLKKRLTKMGIDPVTHKPKNDPLLSIDGQPKNAANLSHMAQWESARLEAEARLVSQSKLRSNYAMQNSLSSRGASTPVARPPCLDILKAWNGAWPKPNEGGGGGGGGVSLVGLGNGNDLESPTSTLSSFTENATLIPETGIVDGGTTTFIELVGNSRSCDHDGKKEECEEDWKGYGSSNQLNGSGNFVKMFTDLLLNNSGGQSLSEGDGDSENGGGSDYFEDNKINYWNSILNLVNSSPSDSPLF